MVFWTLAKLEIYLVPMLGETTHIARGDKFAMIEVYFSSEKVATLLPDRTQRIEVVLLFPPCMVRSKSHLKIEYVQQNVEVAWVIATLCKDDKTR